METYKIKSFFTDVKTGEERNPGDLVEFSQERVKEIQAVDPKLIELVKAEPTPKAQAKAASKK